jgi:hypothetical protein
VAAVARTERLEAAVEAWWDAERKPWPELRYAERPAAVQADLEAWFELTGRWADPCDFHHIDSHSTVEDFAAEWLVARFAPPPDATKSQKTWVRKRARRSGDERWGPVPGVVVYQAWVEAWKKPRNPPRVLLTAPPPDSTP